MTPREYLEQAEHLDQLIVSNLVELERLHLTKSNISPPSLEPHYNATRNTTAPFVYKVEKLMLLEDEIRNETNRLAELRTQIRQTIDSVPNTDERLVLRYRYLQSLTWEEIAMKMHMCNSSVRRWHDLALKHLKLPEKPIFI